MGHKFKYLFYLLSILLNASLGKYHVVKTAKKKYLVKTKNITPRTEQSRIDDFINNENEPAWLDICSLKSEGSMIQKDVPGCGGRIEMSCQRGCLRIIKLLYSCREQQNSNARQLELVRKRCEKKESCMVSSSRQMFGHDECPDAPDEEMNLWIVYRCDGGQDRTRITGAEKCNKKTAVVTPSPSDKCGIEPQGSMIQKDVPGCGGRIEMTCQGGCLRILKILYSCREQQTSNKRQLELVRSRCEKKEKCVVSSSRKLFGHFECPNALDEEMNLWVVYRCDGGQDRTRITGAEGCTQTPTTSRITEGIKTTPWCGFCKSITPKTLPTTKKPTKPAPKTPTTTTLSPQRCPLTHSKMVIKDIRMNSGQWIKIACSANGAGQVPCIFIHKVRAGCGVGDPIQGHMTMIKAMCEGKRSCRIEPTAEMWSPAVTCSAPTVAHRMMWLTYSCDGGVDKTTSSKEVSIFAR